MYAKDYFAQTELLSDPGLCFVLMPFASKFDAVWNMVQKTVASPPFNLLCRRADDIARPGHVMSDVLENIGRARLIIADLTDQNPNVFYELGIAHSVKDAAQVILIASSIEWIPFDLRHLRCVNYEDSLSKLERGLTNTLNELSIKQYALSLREGESGKIPTRLTGDDLCLYEVEITVRYLGEDGVKFHLRVIRYAAEEQPRNTFDRGRYLGVDRPAMQVPGIPWALCYHKPDDTTVRFVLGRPPGWKTST